MILLRSKISSNMEDLNELHKERWWIPNKNMIRPQKDVLDSKREFSKNVLAKWATYRDFILDTHFRYPINTYNNLLIVDDTDKKEEWNFRASLFPYNLPADVNHYVLWNSKYDYFTEFDEVKINRIIKECLSNMLNSDDFDFAWYLNPKPSIPDLWHCQVFWIRA